MTSNDHFLVTSLCPGIAPRGARLLISFPSQPRRAIPKGHSNVPGLGAVAKSKSGRSVNRKVFITRKCDILVRRAAMVKTRPNQGRLPLSGRLEQNNPEGLHTHREPNAHVMRAVFTTPMCLRVPVAMFRVLE